MSDDTITSLPIFIVDYARGVRVTQAKAERIYTRDFHGYYAHEMDDTYDFMVTQLSLYMWGRTAMPKPHRVWSEGRWIA